MPARSTFDANAIEWFFIRHLVLASIFVIMYQRDCLILQPSTYECGAVIAYVVVFGLVLDYFRYFRFGLIVSVLEAIPYAIAWQVILCFIGLTSAIFTCWILAQYACGGANQRKCQRAFLKKLWGFDASN